MRLTPLDIRHKEFSRGMRGYKDLEVDEFLDDIADEFERVFNENIDYEERLEALEEKIEQYKNIEETLKKTLLSAQQQAEELKHNAKKESDLILRDAELKSRSVLNDCYAERQKVQRSVQALKQKHEDLRYQLRSVLETYANILDQEGDFGVGMDESLDAPGAAAAPGTPAAAAPGTSGTAAPGSAPGMRETEAPPGPERLEMDSLPADEPLIISEPPVIDEPSFIDEPLADSDDAPDDVATDSGDENGDASGEESGVDQSFDVDAYFAKKAEPEVSLRDEETDENGEAEERQPLYDLIEDEPAAEPAAGDVAADADDEDPFADAEVDTEDREFKW